MTRAALKKSNDTLCAREKLFLGIHGCADAFECYLGCSKCPHPVDVMVLASFEQIVWVGRCLWRQRDSPPPFLCGDFDLVLLQLRLKY